ncbi:MAG: hypothetical protein WCK72_05280 [Actinomycetes bacterium]
MLGSGAQLVSVEGGWFGWGGAGPLIDSVAHVQGRPGIVTEADTMAPKHWVEPRLLADTNPHR